MTIREYLEATVQEHAVNLDHEGGDPYCAQCYLEPWPCPTYVRMKEALKELNESDMVGGSAAVWPGAPKRRHSHRLVRD